MTLRIVYETSLNDEWTIQEWDLMEHLKIGGMDAERVGCLPCKLNFVDHGSLRGKGWNHDDSYSLHFRAWGMPKEDITPDMCNFLLKAILKAKGNFMFLGTFTDALHGYEGLAHVEMQKALADKEFFDPFNELEEIEEESEDDQSQADSRPTHKTTRASTRL